MRILYNNLWDIAKAVLRGKLIAVNTYTRIYKRERLQITFSKILRELEKEHIKSNTN